MRLTRNQKRWIRRHKGMLITLGIVGVILIAAIVYICLLMAEVVPVPEFLKLEQFQNVIQQMQNNDNAGGETSESTGNNAAVDGGGTENATGASDTANMLSPNPIELTVPEVETVAEYVVPENVEFPYYIKVNRIMNCVTIYGVDDNGEYTIPVKAMICSVGKNDGDTPLDISQTSDIYEFHPMVDGTYGQYAYRFNEGGILFHSVPYYTKDKSDLETEQFNLLGSAASLGCVRLCVRDALWLQQNCPQGTTVEVYDDTTTVGPLGKPEMIKIPLDSPHAGWDPTDPDEANPWHQYSATINGAEDVTFLAGTEYNPAAGITATDTCGNDITDKLIITGMYDCNTPGEYKLTYQVTDVIGSMDSVTITVTVTQ